MNDNNLIPITERTKEERAEMGRKGGLKTQEINRKKRNAKEIMELLLNCRISRDKAREKLGEYADYLPDDATLYDVVNLRQIMESIEGSTKSAEYVRDTTGDKPVERQEITADIMTDADRELLAKVAKRQGITGDGTQ